MTKTWQHMIIWLLHQNKRLSTKFFFREPVYGISRGGPHIICNVMSCHYVSMSFFPSAVSRVLYCRHNFGWQHMAKRDILTWHHITNNVGATSKTAIHRFLKKKWIENLLFWWCYSTLKFELLLHFLVVLAHFIYIMNKYNTFIMFVRPLVDKKVLLKLVVCQKMWKYALFGPFFTILGIILLFVPVCPHFIWRISPKYIVFT